MKAIFTILLFFIFTTSQGQGNTLNMPLDPRTKKISFELTQDVKGYSKTKLYQKTKMWIAEAFNSAKDVINLDDRESGIIKLKGHYDQNDTPDPAKKMSVAFDLLIYIKDYKYKFVMTNILISQAEFTLEPAEELFVFHEADFYKNQKYQLRKSMSEQLKTTAKEIMLSYGYFIVDKRNDF